MKKKGLPIIVLPVLLAICLISLPEGRNLNMQRYLTEKALIISHAFSKNREPGALKSPIAVLEKWQQSQRHELQLKTIQAQTLSPFSILPESNSHDFQIARVIYRSANSYNSSIWINKGKESNILKNSPVLSGDSLIGVVDYVGKKASAVRLITDSGLTPAVRVARDNQDRALFMAVDQVIHAVENSQTLLENQEERKALIYLLRKVANDQNKSASPRFLAKGILQGNGGNLLLKGIGFNYDYKDQYGPSRDLRTGDPIDPYQEYPKLESEALVQVGDLLVTSGMDGVFPEGLKVAYVHSIKALAEGAFAYELYAKPTAGDIQDLQYVTILAPQGFDQSQIPTRLERVIKQLAADD